MRTAVGVLSTLLILGVLWEAFETVIQPRRIRRRFRFTRLFYVFTWSPWRRTTKLIRNRERRETLLAIFGPLSLIMLFVTWGVALVLGFGTLQWALGSKIKETGAARTTIATDLYFSGTTLFTLGLGDVTPLSRVAKALIVAESAIGLGMVALVISYLPTLYQSFSNREVNISLLDARAGSPPAACELMRRYALRGDLAMVQKFLAEWERWSAELLESHLSYPALSYFRSQHTDQSWLAGLTAVLDVCALARIIKGSHTPWQAELTFAICRHTVVDLSAVFMQKPIADAPDRLPTEEFERLVGILGEVNLAVPSDPESYRKLGELRKLYEPWAHALSRFLEMSLPPWLPEPGAQDNWQRSRWRIQ